jgi:D-glycero-D-manno-heptose 1,7-bisphosphate phosphatase
MKLALVGRDGVINEVREGGVNHRTHLQLIPGSIQALANLSAAGYTVIIVTHQPGISRGLLDLDEMEAIHNTITSAVEELGAVISGIFYCPHDEQDRCYCRPPETGLLDVIEMEFDRNVAEGFYFYHSDNEAVMITVKGCQGIHCDDNNRLLNRVETMLQSKQVML